MVEKISKDDYSEVMDHLNKALEYSKNSSSDMSVIKKLREAQTQIEYRFPSLWYQKRDSEFDKICDRIENTSEDLTEEIVQEFYEQFIEKLYNSKEIELES